MSELSDVFGDWMTDTISVQTYDGPGMYGSELRGVETVTEVMVTDRNRIVRNSDGDEQLSDVQIMAEPELGPTFTPKSVVTLPDGRETVVISVAIDLKEMHCAIIFCGGA